MADTRGHKRNRAEGTARKGKTEVPVPESWGDPDLWEERTVLSGQFTKIKENGGIYDSVPVER